MFNYLNLLQSFTPKGTISIHSGSCVRQRYKRAECQHCFAVCPSGALSWSAGALHWNQEQCQHCLLCTAVCPLGALSSDDVSYVSVLKKLQALDAPVLACSTEEKTQGHARVPCLGAFANRELLMALGLALGKPIKLDISHCRKCRNSTIIEQLEETVSRLPQQLQVALVFDQKRLDFRARQCNRRELLTLFRSGAKAAGENPVEQIQISKPPTNYRTKRLSAARNLLLQTIKHYPEQAGVIAESFWPQATFASACHGCHSCVTICPTGALSAPESESVPPSFAARTCVSCGLCEEFCRRSAIQITAT